MFSWNFDFFKLKENSTIKKLSYYSVDPNPMLEDIDLLNFHYEYFLEELTKYLNQIHEVSFSKLYWRVIIGPWLYNFIHIVHDKIKIKKSIIKQYNKVYFLKRPVNLESFQCEDFASFQKMVSENWFNDFLQSLIFKSDKRFIQLDNKSEILDRHLIKSKNYFFLINIYNNIILKYFKQNIMPYQLLNLNISVISKLKLLLMFWKLPLIIPTDYLSKKVNKDLRNLNFDWSKNKNDFLSIFLKKYILYFIPMSYIENYSLIKAQNDNILEKFIPQVIVSSHSHIDIDRHKEFIANAMNKGSKLNVMQHGGGFALNLYHSEIEHENYICDNYLSWGSLCKITKMTYSTSIKLEELKLRKKKFGFCTMFFGNWPKNFYSLGSNPNVGQINRYFQDQNLFIENLNEDVFNNLRIREYFHDYGRNVKNQFYSVNNNIRFFNKNIKLNKIFKNSRIIVNTYNSTTLLECMFHNIPNITFWGDSDYELNRETKLFIKKMKKHNLFFDDPIKAALFINSIWDCIDSWWETKETQLIVKEFQNLYCINSGNALSVFYSNVTSGSRAPEGT